MLGLNTRIPDPLISPEPGEPCPEEPKQCCGGWSDAMSKSGQLMLELAVLLIRGLLIVIETVLRALVPPHEKPLFRDTALVTGAGHGIGRQLAVDLAAQGARVVCLDVNKEGNQETLDLLHARGFKTNVFTYQCDVSDRDAVLSTAKQIQDEVGPITILVNNAGIMPCKQWDQQTHHDITRVFQVNVLAHYWTLQAFLPTMRARNHGHVVAISSMCGVIGLPNLVPYSSTKFAVRGLMEALHEELRQADPNNNVKFTTIYPLMVDSGLVKKPRNRFPSLAPLLTVEEVSAEVVKAIRQELREMSIPSTMLTLDRISRFLPDKLVWLGKDFMDTGVDPDN